MHRYNCVSVCLPLEIDANSLEHNRVCFWQCNSLLEFFRRLAVYCAGLYSDMSELWQVMASYFNMHFFQLT